MRLATCVFVMVALTAVARADDPPFTIGSQPAWFALGGVTTGGTVALAGRGAFVGGELSLARVRDASYVGAYADGYYDWGVHGTYLTGGLELGHKWFGIDGGAAVRLVSGDAQAGITARLNVSLGVAGVYVRYCYFDTMIADHVLQVGVVFKLPFATIGGNAR